MTCTQMLIVLCTGSVMVTFKSRLSVPPYRIENMCSDVVVFFAQAPIASLRNVWNWLTPRAGGNKMAFAWDEPTQQHRLQVRVRNASDLTAANS